MNERRRVRWLGDALLWTGAALAVMSAHAGAVIWATRALPMVAADSPPPAIMIELAPMTEATETQETVLSQDIQDAQASAPAQAVAIPEPEPVEEEVEEEITEDPQPDEVTHEAEVVLSVSPRPRPRPQQVAVTQTARQNPQRDPAPPVPQQTAASQSSVRAQNQQAQHSTRNAARQSAQGAGRSISPVQWQSRLLAHLERHKPRSRGEQGQAHVTFQIDAAGNVSAIRLSRSSGRADVDQAATDLVRRASPVPAPPPGVQGTITVPVMFSRR
ncbi:MAG: energy transducer TonB [Rhodobacteraceae bacterium]|nr:energy transducer TonB [Paracoccaceae bacterium]